MSEFPSTGEVMSTHDLTFQFVSLDCFGEFSGISKVDAVRDGRRLKRC